MSTQPFSPEGLSAAVPGLESLRQGLITGEIFRAMCVKCDEFHNLHLDLGTVKGIIPRAETALGIAEGKLREIGILSRVGKPVCFQVMNIDQNGTVICSRRLAQLDARRYFFSALRPGDILPAQVQTVADFGVFCDIGCGFTALMRIDRCCISRLQSARERYKPGQFLRAAVLSIDDNEGQINLTGRELLGTWEENAENYRQGQTVPGIVRSIMPYGIFVELAPNLSGLAEPMPDLHPGDPVSVYIRAILPQKHKLKLNILEKLPTTALPDTTEYYITSGHIGKWEYYPGSSAVTYF